MLISEVVSISTGAGGPRFAGRLCPGLDSAPRLGSARRGAGLTCLRPFRQDLVLAPGSRSARQVGCLASHGSSWDAVSCLSSACVSVRPSETTACVEVSFLLIPQICATVCTGWLFTVSDIF